jgi:hypothetical protein
VNWLRRAGRTPPPDAPASGEAVPEPIEGAAPGVAAVLDGVSEDQSHAVLDLGRAADTSLRVYSRFARWIRFADVLGDSAAGSMPPGASPLGAALPQAGRAYDLVFAWDVLDRLPDEDRLRLGEWLAANTAPDARLHAVARGSAETLAHPLRFTILDLNRIRFQVEGAEPLHVRPLLPAEVAKLLAPFRVEHAFTLKTGLREYVARRR